MITMKTKQKNAILFWCLDNGELRSRSKTCSGVIRINYFRSLSLSFSLIDYIVDVIEVMIIEDIEIMC